MGRHRHAPGKESAPTQQALNEDTLSGETQKGSVALSRDWKTRLGKRFHSRFLDESATNPSRV